MKENEKEEPEEVIYLFVGWFGLSVKEHECLYRVFDGSGDLIFAAPFNFMPVKNQSCSTYVWYTPRKNIDQPGTWKFEVYLDGEKEEIIKVDIERIGGSTGAVWNLKQVLSKMRSEQSEFLKGF